MKKSSCKFSSILQSSIFRTLSCGIAITSAAPVGIVFVQRVEAWFALVAVGAHYISLAVTFSGHRVVVGIGFPVAHTPVEGTSGITLTLNAHVLKFSVNLIKI